MNNLEETDYGHYAKQLTKEEYDRINIDQTTSEWQRNKLGAN